MKYFNGYCVQGPHTKIALDQHIIIIATGELHCIQALWNFNHHFLQQVKIRDESEHWKNEIEMMQWS